MGGLEKEAISSHLEEKTYTTMAVEGRALVNSVARVVSKIERFGVLTTVLDIMEPLAPLPIQEYEQAKNFSLWQKLKRWWKGSVVPKKDESLESLRREASECLEDIK